MTSSFRAAFAIYLGYIEKAERNHDFQYVKDEDNLEAHSQMQMGTKPDK